MGTTRAKRARHTHGKGIAAERRMNEKKTHNRRLVRGKSVVSRCSAEALNVDEIYSIKCKMVAVTCQNLDLVKISLTASLVAYIYCGAADAAGAVDAAGWLAVCLCNGVM